MAAARGRAHQARPIAHFGAPEPAEPEAPLEPDPLLEPDDPLPPLVDAPPLIEPEPAPLPERVMEPDERVEPLVEGPLDEPGSVEEPAPVLVEGELVDAPPVRLRCLPRFADPAGSLELVDDGALAPVFSPELSCGAF